MKENVLRTSVLFGVLNAVSCLHGNSRLNLDERVAIHKETRVFEEIMELYATESLDRPKDLAVCARAMFAMDGSRACRDRFSHYLTPAQTEEQAHENKGTFIGIGIMLAETNDQVIITSLMAESPAQAAGLKPGDIILAVNGTPVKSRADTMRLIREAGEKPVKLQVARPSTGEQLEFMVTRAEVAIHSVISQILSGTHPVGIVKVSQFIEPTPKDFVEALKTFTNQHIDHVIIDLRDNPGGLLESCAQMLGNFMNKTDTAFITHSRHRDEVWDAAFISARYPEIELGKYRGMHIVILINKSSASASEMFTGAMKDWGYTVVGETSFGKGVGQILFPLSDGAELMLVTFEFFVGNHRVVIRDKGVTPTMELKQADDSKDDLQLGKALELLGVQ